MPPKPPSGKPRASRRSNVVAMVTDPNKAAAKGELDQLRGLTAPQLMAARDRRGWCPLHHAASNGNVDVIALLSEADGLLEVQDNDLCTALHRAVKHPRCVQVLLQSLSNAVSSVINLPSKIGCTPLCLAAASGTIESVQMLLDAGASATITDKRAYSALSHAAFSGHTDIVKLLLKQGGLGAGQTKLSTQGNALLLAARAGRTEVVEILMEAGFDVNVKVSPNGATPLWEAASAGHANVVTALVSRGASVTSAVTKPPESVTAIFAACEAGHDSVIKALLDRMSTTGARTSYLRLLKRQCRRNKLTAMHAAAGAGHVNVVRLLLEAENRIELIPQPLERVKSAASMFSATSSMSRIVNVAEGKLLETIDNQGRSALHVAAESAEGSRVVPLLLSSAANQGLPLLGIDNKGRSPVHTAAEFGMFGALKEILGALEAAKLSAAVGSGAGHLDYFGESALIKACRAGHKECVSALVDAYSAGANGNKLINCVSDGPNGTTALIEAAKFNHVDVCKSLLVNPACQAMCPDASGWTALHTAAYHGGSEILALLIEKGVDVDSGGGLHDGTGITALHRACCHDQNDAVLQLISARADPCRRDNRGWTGIHHAAAVGISPNRAVATLLSNHDVDISTVDREGSQALHIAASAGHTDFCRFLVQQHGADITAIDKNGRTVLHLAVLCSSSPLVEMLCTLAHDVEAFVNAMDSVGQTALMLAITVGALNFVEILLNKGAKINVTDKTGASALHIAIRCYIDRSVDGIDFMNFIALLLHKGASANEKDSLGKSPFELALDSKDAAVIQCFQGGYLS